MCVDFLDPLHHLEQTRSAGDAPSFQTGRHSKADGLLCAAQVRHHQIGSERIEAALDALNAGIE